MGYAYVDPSHFELKCLSTMDRICCMRHYSWTRDVTTLSRKIYQLSTALIHKNLDYVNTVSQTKNVYIRFAL
jgi:hypothetical protein